MATLTQEWICFILFRFAMPVVFLAATIFRFNIFSLLYGLLMLTNALLSRPTYFSMTRGLTGKYLMVAMVLMSVTLLSQSVFQIYAAVTLKQTPSDERLSGSRDFENVEADANNNTNNFDDYDQYMPNYVIQNVTDVVNCTLLDDALDQVGLQRIQHNDALNVIRILCPDVASFLVTLVCLWCCQAWLTKPATYQPTHSRADEQICKCANIVSLYLGNITLVGLIAMAGILCPSLINLTYFLVFILSMTMWSLVVDGNVQLLWFQRIRYFIATYSALHILVLYLRQFSRVDDFWEVHIAEGSLCDRLLGVTRFTKVTRGCGVPQFIEVRNDLPPLRYVHVFVLLLMYFVLASEIRRWMIKMKFLTIRNVVNVNSIHQKILLKGDADEPYMSGNDGTLGSKSNRGSVGSVTFDPVMMSSFPSVDPNRNHSSGSFSSFYAVKEYALKQSYIGTLIVMMVWSITYHSWLTFVLLLGACIIWIMPMKRAVCLKLSPIILFYAIGLLMLQYIYGLDLTNQELPDALKNGFELRDIGLVKYTNPAGPLAIKLMFTCVFWLTLRHSQERKCGLMQQDTEITMDTFGINKRSQQLIQSQSHENDLIRNIGFWIWHTMCKYWIFACAGVFLFISLQEAVVFRLIYMTMFLYFVITFQVSYKFWRMSIQVFWWVVILYSMGVLTCIYTFQFKGFPDHWKYITGMNDQMLLNLGLKKIDTTELFIDLLTPTSFLIVVSIQLHYFQKDFLKMSDLNRFKSMGVINSSETKDTLEPLALVGRRARIHSRRPGVVRLSKKDRFLVFCTYLWNKAFTFLNLTSAVLWRYVEVHIFKVTTSTIFICCVTQISALNTLLVVVVVVLLPFPRLHSAMLILEMILASAILLFKMIYQMDIIVDDLMSSNCSPADNPMNGTLNNTDFIGIHKVKNMARYLMIYILMILMLGLESVVRYHQAQHYRHPNHERPKDGVVFVDIKRAHADQGLKQCFKFFVNYSFYKFGKELCFIVTMTTMVVRLDMYSVVYGLFLGVLLLLNRRHCAFVWPFYIAILVVLLIAQYLSCVGAPPALCWVYPWSNNIYRNLKIFLYLPDYNHPPFPHKLICDFFQLLFACLQWNVFYIEANKLSEYGGDDNRSIYNRLKNKIKNPQIDFLSYKDSYLDYIKMVVFYHSFWVTLMVVFISGMSRISLFCMGYLIGCFVFLWFGEGMLLKPLNKLIAMWMGLLMYCYLVLLAKCILQLIGCVYLSALVDKHCWIIQLFNIVCLGSANYVFDGFTEEKVCKMSVGEAGLSWDAFCFVFLLMMLRIFKTWYFQHVVNELRINSKLAARGAELINNKLIDDINMVKSNEERVLENIKLKMDRIRTKHAACMQERFISKEQYADHYTVIRSGDYYMFKDVDDDDVDMNEGDTVSEEEESNNKESDDWRRKRTTVAPGTLLATALFGGPKEALSLIEKTSNFSRSISMSSAREFTTPEDEAHSPSSLLDGTASTALGSDTEDPILERRPTSADRSSTSTTTILSSPHSIILSSPHSTILSSPHSIVTTFTPPPIPPVVSEATTQAGAVAFQKVARYSDIMPCLPEVTLEMENDVSPGAVPGGGDDDDEKPEDEKDEAGETEGNETTKKVGTGLKMLKAVLIGFIDTLIIRINNSTRHYRTVSQKLHEEKEREKILLRDSVMREHKEEFEETEGDHRDGLINHKDDEINNRKRKENEFHNTMPRVIVLIIAISETLAARTDLLCYFAMVVNTLMSASILSIVYPLSVFFWGMLSVPRPTKFYWVATITYTEFIIVLKYLFQFNFFPWNKGVPGKFTWPQIIGIEKKEMYAALDFFVLFCLFIHRMMLKKRGLWTQGQKDERKVIEVKPSYNDECDNLNPMASDSNANTLGAGDNASRNAEDYRSNTLCHKIFNPIKVFYINITNPKYSAVNDVFAYMFACDLLTFLIVVFGYNKFGPSEQLEDSDVTTVIQQSRVPVPFLAMLLVQFILIIIDRALYLRKLIFGKFIFHIILVIIVHIWMFFLLPIVITDIPFVQNRAAQLWYFTKCVYFSFSCYQVRSGYPIRILGNFLTKKFGYFNLFCYKGFLAIPFLLELRALTDWMWTDTTLALTSWLQMEEIYANVFVLKCWRKIEHDSPTPRGLPRHPVVKYGLGGLILFLLIFIIWLPLLLFSMSNSIYEANPPKSVQFKLSIGGYNTSSQPIFSIVSQHNQLRPIDTISYLNLKEAYMSKPKAMAFLNAHREEDVYRIMIGATSATTWEISYPTEQKLINETKAMRNMSFTVEISIAREEPQASGMITNVVPVVFVKNLNSSNDEDKNVLLTLSRMINGSYNESVVVPRLFPRYLTVPSRRKVNETGVLEYEWRSIRLSLHQIGDDRSRWWEMKENCSEPLKENSLDNLVCGSGDGSMVVVFSERVPTGVFTLVNNYGVIGLYVSVILVIGRFVRMQSVGNIQTIMFTNLPYVERLYLLCMDIYLVRQAGEFSFEELLFAKLNFLYRSSETMIAWTRHPKPKSD